MHSVLPKGKYYFGDICYIMDDEVYHKVWGDKLGFADGKHDVDFVDSKGKHWTGTFAVAGTAYGDGCYTGVHKDYGVDAGVLGLVPESLWDSEKGTGDNLGMIFTVKDSVTFKANDGKFSVDCKGFNEYVNTNDEDDEDDEDEDDEENEEEDEE